MGQPEGYLERARELGYDTLGLCEEDFLCALQRFETAARETGVRPILGGTATTAAGPLPLLCRNRAGYRALCRLIARAHLEQPRGSPQASLEAVEQAAGDGLFVLTGGRRGRLAEHLRAGDQAGAERWLRWLVDRFGGDRVIVELQRLGYPGDTRLTLQQADLARRLGLAYAATADVRYERREDYPVYDIAVCTRHLRTVDEAFAGRPINDLQYLCDEETMRRRFADLPEALAATRRIADACEPLNLESDRYLPTYNGVTGEHQPRMLEQHAFAGMRERYPRRRWRAVTERVREELRIIGVLGLEGYFLLVWDICRWAREQGIVCAGRGSAAGSVVCYCLRISNVDAHARGITVARFLNEERLNALPDIDVDFDRAGREEILDYVTRRYGPEHVAMTGTYTRYHARSAIRDVGRALGLPADDIHRLARSLPSVAADRVDLAAESMPDVRSSPWAESRFALLRRLVPKLAGLPRHLGTHLGGVILCPEPLAEVAGVQLAAKGCRVFQGDKEDAEMRFCKLDLLSLPMLGVVRDAGAFVQERQPEFEVFDLPLDDEATYARLRRSETIGAFEVGSPAQRALHARLECADFEPLVAALALIRPGPIKGNMGDRYLKRRLGQEPVEYWLPELEPALARTYGVLVYQEQVIDVARIAAGLSPAEADLVRRSISHYRSEEQMAAIGRDLHRKITARGVPDATAEAICLAIIGFAGYGFCESHAAAFADVAYRSVYLIEHHPAEYFAALLRHQPMGFYPVHTLVDLVRRRGVEVVAPCINHGPALTEAAGGALRVGLAQIRHILPETAERIVAGRPYATLGELRRGAGLRRNQLVCLIQSGACDSLSPHRQALIWQAHELPTHLEADGGLGLEVPDPVLDERLPRMTDAERLAGEWAAMGFSPTGHPLALRRDELARRGITPAGEVAGREPGTWFRVAGLVMRPHRPPTRTGRNTLFFDLEDETGVVSITCFKDVYQADGHHVLRNPMVIVSGKVDARTGLSLIADRVRPLANLDPAEALASPHARTLY